MAMPVTDIIEASVGLAVHLVAECLRILPLDQDTRQASSCLRAWAASMGCDERAIVRDVTNERPPGLSPP